MLGNGAEGLEGAHYSMLSVLLLTLKNNTSQSSHFLVNANQHSQKTYADTSQLHMEMHQVQTGIQNLLAGRHCTTEYNMHMYSFCSKINIVYISGRTILFSLSSSWRIALQQEPSEQHQLDHAENPTLDCAAVTLSHH